MNKIPLLERFSHKATEYSGSTWGFLVALAIILTWAATGPMFGFSDTWQLVINTGTTIVTFLMVFLIQRSQNKDSKAIHLKLNELVAALQGASNRLVDVEAMSEEEISVLHKHFQTLSELAKHEGDIRSSHSVEEAEKRGKDKLKKKAS